MSVEPKTILEERIEQKGLKKKWIAEQIDVSQRTFSEWIQYNNIEQVKKIGKLMELLEIVPMDLFEDIEKMDKEKEE